MFREWSARVQQWWDGLWGAPASRPSLEEAVRTADLTPETERQRLLAKRREQDVLIMKLADEVEMIRQGHRRV